MTDLGPTLSAARQQLQAIGKQAEQLGAALRREAESTPVRAISMTPYISTLEALARDLGKMSHGLNPSPSKLEQLSDLNEEFNRIAGIGSGASPEEMQAASQRLDTAYKAWRQERFADKFELAAADQPDLTRADHQLTADELRQKYFDPNDRSGGEGEHPRFSKWDWHQTVAQRSTLLGYWDWVEAQAEQAYDEEV